MLRLSKILKEIEAKTKGLTGLNPDEYETNSEKNFAGHHAGDMYMGYMGSPSDKDTVDFDDADVAHKPEIYDPKKDKVKRGYEPVVNEDRGPCWKGYQQIGMKTKDGKEVPNCVPNNEAANSNAIGQPGGFYGDEYDTTTNETDLRDTDSEINYGNVEPEEYDVDNYDDYKDFMVFIRNYNKELNEGCSCLLEAEYQGREVKLGKPMAGDVKKFKVYVKNPQGNVVKVNFGHGGSSAASKGEKTMRIRKSNPAARKSFRARHNCDNPGPRTKARYWSCRKW